MDKKFPTFVCSIISALSEICSRKANRFLFPCYTIQVVSLGCMKVLRLIKVSVVFSWRKTCSIFLHQIAKRFSFFLSLSREIYHRLRTFCNLYAQKTFLSYNQFFCYAQKTFLSSNKFNRYTSKTLSSFNNFNRYAQEMFLSYISIVSEIILDKLYRYYINVMLMFYFIAYISSLYL